MKKLAYFSQIELFRSRDIRTQNKYIDYTSNLYRSTYIFTLNFSTLPFFLHYNVYTINQSEPLYLILLKLAAKAKSLGRVVFLFACAVHFAESSIIPIKKDSETMCNAFIASDSNLYYLSPVLAISRTSIQKGFLGRQSSSNLEPTGLSSFGQKAFLIFFDFNSSLSTYF